MAPCDAAQAGTILNVGMKRTSLLALALVIACDALDPKDEPVVVYDVTTTLEKFSFETAAPSPPDCPASPSMSPYCTHVRPFFGATLSGVLTLKFLGDSAVPAGTFTGKMCSAIDYAGLTGCTAVTERSDEYGPSTPSMVTRGPTSSTIAVHLQVGALTDFKPLLTLYGPMDEDSIWGNVVWIAYQSRSPPGHSGQFVARRRR
jgi:hypothetical protein